MTQKWFDPSKEGDKSYEQKFLKMIEELLQKKED